MCGIIAVVKTPNPDQDRQKLVRLSKLYYLDFF